MPQESDADALLSAVVRCSELLLGSVDINVSMKDVLPAIGAAANLSRIKVFLRIAPDDGLRLAYEWWTDGLTSQTDLGFTHFPEESLREVEHMWRDNGYHWGYVEAWPEPLLSVFRRIGVLSVGVVSLMAGRRYAGCVAFDCCNERRHWSRPEINALTAASQAIGAAMRREEVEREHKELYASEREEAARRSAASQLQAALSERERIAAELHDGLQQVMIALSLQAQSTSRLLAAIPGAEQALLNLDEIASTAHLGLAELKAAVLEAGSPATISVLDLEMKLRELCSTLDSARLRCSFELNGARSIDNLDCTHLLRIAQEAVTNAWKHSGGSALEVKLQHGPGGLHLSIADNGRGFDVAAAPSGRGLKNMAERANQCGAILRVVSNSSGSHVQVLLPEHRGESASFIQHVIYPDAMKDLKQQRIRILLVDDHAMVRRGLRAFLEVELDFEVVGEASDAASAISKHSELHPDVTIMDLRLPDLSGIDATKRILQAQPDAKIIVVTTADGDGSIYAAMASGAVAYLTKDTMETELIAAVRKVLRGKRVLSTGAAAVLAEHLDRVELTVREHEVLVLMAKGLSNPEIGSILGTTAGTVKMQAHSLFAKLGTTDRTEAVTVAIKRGLLEL